MNDKKDKQVFTETLKGLEIARDVFGTPIVEGEIILYAVMSGHSIDWRVGKILEVIRKKDVWDRDTLKLKVRRATKGWGTKSQDWTLQDKHSYLTNVNNAFVLTDPKPEITELFKDI